MFCFVWLWRRHGDGWLCCDQRAKCSACLKFLNEFFLLRFVFDHISFFIFVHGENLLELPLWRLIAANVTNHKKSNRWNAMRWRIKNWFCWLLFVVRKPPKAEPRGDSHNLHTHAFMYHNIFDILRCNVLTDNYVVVVVVAAAHFGG